MIIYLANGYGFSKQQSQLLLPELIKKLESFGHEVWEPFARNNNVDFSNPDWAYNVGQACKSDVENSDAIFAVVNSNPPDEGVMIELGMAIALKKKIYLFRDDFRTCSDSDIYPLNLMLFCGFDKDNWKQFYFKSIEEIKL